MKLRKKDRQNLAFSKDGVAIATIKNKERFVFVDGRVLKLANLPEKEYQPYCWFGKMGIIELESGYALVGRDGVVDGQRYAKVLKSEKLFPNKLVLIGRDDSFSLWNGENCRTSFQCEDGPNTAMYFEILSDLQFDSAFEIEEGSWAVIATCSSGKKCLFETRSMKIFPLQADVLKVAEDGKSFKFRAGQNFGQVVFEKGQMWIVDGGKHIQTDSSNCFKEEEDSKEEKAENKKLTTVSDEGRELG